MKIIFEFDGDNIRNVDLVKVHLDGLVKHMTAVFGEVKFWMEK